MLEKDLNRTINYSFNKLGWGFKIADPQRAVVTVSAKNPFDGFAVTQDNFVYYESKLLKGGYKAFSFSLIQEHQIKNLLRIKQVNPEALCLILLGIWERNVLYEIMAFDIMFILGRLETGKKSLLKTELLSFRVADKVVKKEKDELGKDIFNMQRVLDRIIKE
jgi:penicillin-binding protein-related factor A (putative recombinase)